MLDVDALIEQGFKKQFGRSSMKSSARSLAPHSGRLEAQLEDQLHINRHKKLFDKLRAHSERKEPALKLPSIMPQARPKKKEATKLQSPEVAQSKEAELRELLGIEEEAHYISFKEQVVREAGRGRAR